MTGRIPQAFLDDLIDRVDIVDVVDRRVKLKKSGKNYSACCPFHEEKTPSFTVSPDKQFYYCFGCGASGNALGFIMEYEHIEFPSAVEELAKTAGVTVPQEDRKLSPAQIEKEKQRKDIYQLLEKANDYYQAQLREHSRKTQAVNYLKGRGLSGQICKQFEVGFAPPGWNNLTQHLGEDPHTLKRLEQAGMLIENQEKKSRYDRFRERIMFPIRDHRGRVIGFGGRVLGDDKPKYLNSPETPVFHKGEELYGLWEARQANSQLKRLLVVEGYMDVVALAQYGISYGVATLGTACGETHLTKAFRFTQEIIFCFDGDDAGRNAAKRALANSLPAMTDGRQIQFHFLPQGEDPDSLIRQLGTEKFLERLDTASTPLEEFLFDSLCEDLNATTMGGKALLSKRAAPLLHQLPKGVYRELMFASLAKRTELPLDTLMELVEQPADALAAPEPKAEPEPHPEEPSAPAHTKSEPQHFSEQNHHDIAAEYYGQTDNQSSDQKGPEETDGHHGYEEFAQQHLAQQDPGQHGSDDHYDAGGPTQINQRPRSSVLLTPQRLIIGLLINEPQLGQDLNILELCQQQNDDDSQLLLKLGQCLKARPHFNLAQLTGFWLASHGNEEWQKLKTIAEQTTQVLQASRQGFDYSAELNDCQTKMHQQFKHQQQQKRLNELRNKPLAELTSEEKALYLEKTRRPTE